MTIACRASNGPKGSFAVVAKTFAPQARPPGTRVSAREGRGATTTDAGYASAGPYFPEDFDWATCNAAPSDQQCDFLAGDEPYGIAGVRPDGALLEGSLPAAEPADLPGRSEDGGERLVEVALQLDTVLFDGEAEQVSLVWRGACPSRTRTEAGSSGSSSSSIRRAKSRARRGLGTHGGNVDPRFGADRASARHAKAGAIVTEQRAATVTDLRSLLTRRACKLPSRPLEEALQAQPISSRSRCPSLQARRAGASFRLAREGRESGRPGSVGRRSERARSPGADLSGAVLSHATLRGAKLDGARCQGCASFEPMRGLELHRRGSEPRRCTAATLCNANLSHAILSQARLAQADLEHADLSASDASGASFVRARLARAKLDQAELSKADLSGANLERASFAGAKLDDAKAYGAVAPRSCSMMPRCSTPASTKRACRLCPPGAEAAGSSWKERFFPARASSRRAPRPGFDRADLEGAKLDGADARESRLRGASPRRIASRRQPDAGDLRAGRSAPSRSQRSQSLSAETWQAKLGGARLDGALVAGTKLAK